eukprot:TRINITY_DN2613_c2_g2_i1.p1 TRINITY_DN2613_c2_g2~~TRINITY_DN2613_c2_g2_i1.p1  ORF type:complete len:711 (+),score=211.41 TRINITY_DN2613_c2_g2_i1:79-2211(+)
MGGRASTLNVETNALLQSLRDSEAPNDQIRWSDLTSLSDIYPDALTHPASIDALRAACASIVEVSNATGRCAALCKAICGIVAGHSANRPEEVPYRHVCSLLLLLQVLLQEVIKSSRGSATLLRSLCALEGGGSAGQVVIDTMVAFIVKHPVLNMKTECLNAHCMVLGVVTIACGAQLWADPDDLLQQDLAAADRSLLCMASPIGDPTGQNGMGDLIDYLVMHPSSHALVRSLLAYVTKAEFPLPDAGHRGPLGMIWDLAAYLISPFKHAAPHHDSAGRRGSVVGHGGDTHVHIGGAHSDHGGAAHQADNAPPSSHLGRRAVLVFCIMLYRRKNTAKTNPSAVMSAFRAEEEEFPSGSLYDVFCRPGALHHPELVLLLYTLLIENAVMLDHILNVQDVGRLVLPLTHVLYNVEPLFDKPSSLYVLMSVLLMLSQYRRFNSGIHASPVASVTWCKGRGPLRDITAGSLLIVTLVKVIQASIVGGQDEYVTRQAFSILSNMGADIRGLHEYPSRRLLQLVLFLAKSACKSVDMEYRERCLEYLRNVLGCIALCLHQDAIVENIQLLYELLHQHRVLSDTLSDLRKLEMADDTPVTTLAHLVDTLDFFSSSLDSDTLGTTPDVAAVTESLTRVATSQWCSPLAETPVPDRYGFAEGDTPESFFVPYSWELVLAYYGGQGLVDWDASQFPLFAKILEDEEEEQVQEDPTQPQQV